MDEHLDLKQMRQFSATLSRVIDKQTELLVDRISNWPEEEVIAALRMLNRIAEGDQDLDTLTDEHFQEMATLASLALQTIVKCIADKNIFLEENEHE